MSLTFYIGRSGSGKTTAILREIEEQQGRDPFGQPVIYLVPDQMTFQSEYALTTATGGLTRAQVFSFSRLALQVLQETGGIARYHLQRTGIHMLLRKIVEREKERLNVFAKATDTNGFIDQLEQIVSEFKRYAVTPDTLEARLTDLLAKENLTPQETVLADKLHDMSLIFDRLEEELQGAYVGTEDYLQILAENIPHSSYLAGADVYVDGFHSFTPQELNVLEQLLATAGNVTVSLTLDKSYDYEPPHELDLFHMTGSTYQILCQLAKEAKCNVEQSVLFDSGKRYNEPALAHLEQSFEMRPPPRREAGDSVRIMEAVHRRAEVEEVAREILRLVREEGYRYRDIALLLRNMDEYADLLETVFKDYEIPLFMDRKRSMLNHPVIELIRSSLDIIHGNWRYEAVFRCLKTDLLFPVQADWRALREKVDQLENYVLAYGIQGKRWHDQEPWTYRRKRTIENEETVQTDRERVFAEQINRLREQLTQPLDTFERHMKKAETVRERCRALYMFLEKLNVPQKIEQMRESAATAGDLSRSREHDQVWAAVIDLLDQMVEMAGEEHVSADLFRSMMDTGLESMRFAIVPPAMDQVIAADMERSRLSSVRCTFILGVNDGVIPAKPDEDSIISEEERKWLDAEGVKLAPGSTRQLLDEPFLMYMAQASPADRLYYTYPLADDEGRSLLPSLYIKRVKDLFLDLEETLILNEPHEVAEEKQLAFINRPRKTLSYLTYQLQSWQKGYPVAPFWWDVYNWFVHHDRWQSTASVVLSSLFYKNGTTQLDEQTSRDLYGEHILTSVSRMERYQACAFSQFATYGLRLKERDTYRLEAPDVGQLFHAALKEMAEHLRRQNKDWASLSKEECKHLAKEIVRNLSPRIQREILLSSNRYHYLQQKLEEVVSRASAVLSEQAKASGFSPVGLEVGFGPEEELPPLRFKLDNSCTMEVVGRIDRVDKATGGKGTLLRIIDYKSSAKDIRLTEVYFGLALQMLVYLDVVISFSEDWLGSQADPAGVLYFHVHNPIVQASQTMSEEDIEQELLKKFKMKGLLTANEESVQMMDRTLSSGHSHIVPVGMKKNGGFYSNSSVIREEDYASLRHYLRRQVQQIGSAITDGKVAINPYKIKQQTPCAYCPFKAVCQFDPTLETNDYRLLKLEKDAVILEAIRAGGNSREREVEQ